MVQAKHEQMALKDLKRVLAVLSLARAHNAVKGVEVLKPSATRQAPDFSSETANTAEKSFGRVQNTRTHTHTPRRMGSNRAVL